MTINTVKFSNVSNIAYFFPWPAVCGIFPVLFIWRHCCNYWRTWTTYRKWKIDDVNNVYREVLWSFKYMNRSLLFFWIPYCFYVRIIRTGTTSM